MIGSFFAPHRVKWIGRLWFIFASTDDEYRCRSMKSSQSLKLTRQCAHKMQKDSTQNCVMMQNAPQTMWSCLIKKKRKSSKYKICSNEIICSAGLLCTGFERKKRRELRTYSNLMKEIEWNATFSLSPRFYCHCRRNIAWRIESAFNLLFNLFSYKVINKHSQFTGNVPHKIHIMTLKLNFA